MVLQVVLIQHIVHEARRVRHPGGVRLGIGAVQRQVEFEVGKILLDLVELVEVGNLLQGARAVPERHGTVGLFGFEQMHQVAAHRSHARTAADEDQLLRVGQVVGQEELAVRTRDRDLVTRLARENIRRADTRIDLHEAARSLVERRRGDTDVEHDDIALGRVVGHRVGTERRLGIGRHEIPHLELVPVGAVLLVHVHVREFDGVVLRNVDLNVAAAAEFEVLALGQLHDELFEESRDIAVRDHRALPLLDAQDGLVDVDFHVLLHFHLTAQTPVVLGHLARDEARFGGQDVAAAFEHLAFAHAARTAAAAGRRQEHLVVGQRREQRRAALGRDDLLAVVDVDRHVARGGQFRLRIEKQCDQHERNHQKGCDRN